MIRLIYDLEIITPGFSGGAVPQERAEIRPSAVRGQLRWWFRTLGGFKSLEGSFPNLKAQEDFIFGTIAGNEGDCGKLSIRVSTPVMPLSSANADDLSAGMNTPLGYALFPLRPFGNNDGKRGVLAEGTRFELQLIWRGPAHLKSDINSLICIWGNLGALGFRSRRGFGSLKPVSQGVTLEKAFEVFLLPQGIRVRKIRQADPLGSWRKTAEILLHWYRSWRQHGQMYRRWNRQTQNWVTIPENQRAENRAKPGFRFARRDHNEGLDVQGTRAPANDPESPFGNKGVTFRPTLGLPIIQFFSSLGGPHGPIARKGATVNWEMDPDGGRFASPVILRPHKDAKGVWHALVIFVDAKQWPDGKQVFLNGQPRTVSLELYNAMKEDRRLANFP